MCGAIGVKTRFLLSGSTIGPPQLSEYPVDPVGVDTISPSAQYVFKYWPLSLASIVIKDVVFFLETVISFNAYFSPLRIQLELSIYWKYYTHCFLNH